MTEQLGPEASVERCSENLSLLFSKTNPSISHSAVKNLAAITAQLTFLRASLAPHCALSHSVLTLPPRGDKMEARGGGVIGPVSQPGSGTQHSRDNRKKCNEGIADRSVCGWWQGTPSVTWKQTHLQQFASCCTIGASLPQTEQCVTSQSPYLCDFSCFPSVKAGMSQHSLGGPGPGSRVMG